MERLDHPGIPKVFDYGVTESGDPFLSREYIEGDSLAFLLRRQTEPDIALCRKWLLSLSAVLRHVHERGYIHTDLQPENIIVRGTDSTPSIALVGFSGAATPTELRDCRYTFRGAVEYVSLEQLLGRSLDVRADIYSFGVIAYELLTGKLPLRLPHPVCDEKIKAARFAMLHAFREFECPKSVNPAIPFDLAAGVSACMEKLPKNRFPGAKALEEYLVAADGAGLVRHFGRFLREMFCGSSDREEQHGTIQ